MLQFGDKIQIHFFKSSFFKNNSVYDKFWKNVLFKLDLSEHW